MSDRPPRNGNSSRNLLGRTAFIALAVGLFLFPSVKYGVLLTDGPDTDFYGFPLPWNSRGIATSLSKSIYIAPLLVDVALYVGLSYWLIRLLSDRIERARRGVRGAILMLIWAYGTLSAMLLGAMWAVLDVLPSFWYWLDVEAVQHASLSLSF